MACDWPNTVTWLNFGAIDNHVSADSICAPWWKRERRGDWSITHLAWIKKKNIYSLSNVTGHCTALPSLPSPPLPSPRFLVASFDFACPVSIFSSFLFVFLFFFYSFLFTLLLWGREMVFTPLPVACIFFLYVGLSPAVDSVQLLFRQEKIFLMNYLFTWASGWDQKMFILCRV